MINIVKLQPISITSSIITTGFKLIYLLNAKTFIIDAIKGLRRSIKANGYQLTPSHSCVIPDLLKTVYRLSVHISLDRAGLTQ